MFCRKVKLLILNQLSDIKPHSTAVKYGWFWAS
jgi:hypothetical protein